ncbi:MAG TPA: TlpA disulfide reductase family protein [Euzebya sp.]|nr:TlpA disulfide reductase family protein [Euzebya sp.]
MADLPPPDATATTAAAGQARTLLVGGGLGVALLLVIVAVLALSGGEDVPAATPGTASPQAASGFVTDAVATLPLETLEGFAGGPDLAVEDLLGGVPLVINFWATWCPPCVAEMPDLQALHEAGDGAFRMVGINVRDAAFNAEDFIDELGITYEQAVDAEESYFRSTGGFGMPTTLFVRPDGSVAYRQTGPLTLTEMQDLLRQHLDVAVTVDADGWLDPPASR